MGFLESKPTHCAIRLIMYCSMAFGGLMGQPVPCKQSHTTSALCVWHLSLSVRLSRFIHVEVCVCVSCLFMAQ